MDIPAYLNLPKLVYNSVFVASTIFYQAHSHTLAPWPMVILPSAFARLSPVANGPSSQGYTSSVLDSIIPSIPHGLGHQDHACNMAQPSHKGSAMLLKMSVWKRPW